MANIRSAEKQNRQAAKRREQNRAERSKLRSSIRKTRAALDKGVENGREILGETYSTIDKAAKHRVITRNTASRYKSRLARRAKRGASGA